MGKLLVKIGRWIIKTWSHMLCLYNKMVMKLTVKVEGCPNQTCTCKK